MKSPRRWADGDFVGFKKKIMSLKIMGSSLWHGLLSSLWRMGLVALRHVGS